MAETMSLQGYNNALLPKLSDTVALPDAELRSYRDDLTELQTKVFEAKMTRQLAETSRLLVHLQFEAAYRSGTLYEEFGVTHVPQEIAELRAATATL